MGNEPDKIAQGEPGAAPQAPPEGPAHAPAAARAGAGAAIHEEIEGVLRGLMVAARMLLLYPSGHQRVTQRLTGIRDDLARLFVRRPEPLELSVAGHRLLVGETKFDQFSEIGEGFAVLLRHRQIRAVVLSRGVDLDEIRLLVELLRIDHRALLRVGGTQAFVDERPHPHVRFLLFEGGATPVMPDGASGMVDSPALDPLLRAVADETAVTAHGSSTEAMREPPIPGDPASEQERFEQQLEEFALRDLLEEPPHTADGEEAVAFPIDADLLGDADVRACLEDDGGSLRERMRRHSSEDTALRILFRLLAEAPDAAQYRHRRHMLLQAVRDPRFFTGELLHVIRRLLDDRTDWGFERGTELAQSVIAYVKDAAAVTQLLASIPLVPEVARGVLTGLAAREDALPLLARLLTADLPKTIAEDLPRIFIELADADPRRFAQWALQDRSTLLRATVVRTLLEKSPGLLNTVCERLLLERQAHDRKKLLHLLASNGSDHALQLLARSVRACGRGVAHDALQALGRFPHPLALEVLREIVERNNGEQIDLEEVEAAVHSIHTLGIKEAQGFLWEVVQSRRSLFSYAYARPIRAIAESLLRGGGPR